MNPVESKDYLSVKEASSWASNFLGRDVSISNVSYLIQYGKVKKYYFNREVKIRVNDLINYYNSFHGKRELTWKNKLGQDLNWALSFDHLREKDTTKHVHRLHPYKGKFIPQLVEYFIDQHTDQFKTESYFQPGDIILDPFSGSGTTMVQANELGIHSIGIDISRFNCMIAEVKLLHYDLGKLKAEVQKVILALTRFESDEQIRLFERELTKELYEFNNRYFPNPEYKYRLYRKELDENFAKQREKEFLKIYNDLVGKYKVELQQKQRSSFLDTWFIESVRNEIDFAFSQIKKINDTRIKKILAVILSRTIRSCRATTHSDLATLKSPQITTYYCFKHKKICKPIFSIKNMFSKYVYDTLDRLDSFEQVRKNAHCAIVAADSRTVGLDEEIRKKSSSFYQLLTKKKIRGIFSSPPYVGQIDYHEQHAYAYDLLGFRRQDGLEIGPLYKGQGAEAKRSYIDGIAAVLTNSCNYMASNYEVFLVANDKHNLYPMIADKSGMKIVNQFKRPVLNRTERDKSPYSEIIFHLRRK